MGAPRQTGWLVAAAALAIGLTLAVIVLPGRSPPGSPDPTPGSTSTPGPPPPAPPGEATNGLPYPDVLHRIPPEWSGEPVPRAQAVPPPRAKSPPPVPPSAGWQLDAAFVIDDVRRILSGGPRPNGGAYAQARAEALRADLARFPPPAAELRRMLTGGESDRLRGFVALAARPPEDDALVSLALRTVAPADDAALRFLGAELVAALPPERVSRLEADVVRAFEAERSPLVFAAALPGLERLEEGSLARLLRAQLAGASPEMRDVLLRLAETRVGRAALGELESAAAPSAAAGGGAAAPP